MKRNSGVLFISWAPYCSRSDGIAKRLGGKSWMIYSPEYGSNYITVIFKYLAQSWKTLRLLFRERPGAVFVMTPPVIACFPVWLYAVLTGAVYMIDAHTGAFFNPRWTGILFLHRFFSRHALATIVTNEYLQKIVHGWGAATLIIRDVPLHFVDPAPVRLSGRCNMVYVSGSLRDEPLDLFLRVASRLPEIGFHMTGNTKRIDPKLKDSKPANVRFTGFLSDAEYVGTLLAADAVIALTTIDHTMQRGAYEAAYLGRPIITSDFDLLRRAFPLGTVHVKSTEDDMVRGFQEMAANLEKYRSEVPQLREQKWAQWKTVESKIRAMLGQVGVEL
jgi:glycosyltransferase involved in cell wall biosynthesis